MSGYIKYFDYGRKNISLKNDTILVKYDDIWNKT